MREGNLPRDSKCVVCKKNCHSMECFTGMRCGWCNITAHAICYRQVKKECDFGQLRKIMLPPNSVTIPRTELPMEQLLNIHPNSTPIGTFDGARKVSSPSRITAEQEAQMASYSDHEKESDDHEILRSMFIYMSLIVELYQIGYRFLLNYGSNLKLYYIESILFSFINQFISI